MLSRVFVDIGNTNTKWKFEGSFYISSTNTFETKKLPECSNIWVSNVSTRSFNFNNASVTFVESQERYKSLTNIYNEPSLLGSDRWLGMISSYEMSQGKSFIFLDIGTAITIDVVNKYGKHQGGLIFPGLDRLRKTFNNFQVLPAKSINVICQSTEDAWTIGTLSLIVNSINHRVEKLKIELPDALIYITGGGYLQIRDFLEFDHYYNENIVIEGLELFADNMG
jgi:type III pantothenate kinase